MAAAVVGVAVVVEEIGDRAPRTASAASGEVEAAAVVVAAGVGDRVGLNPTPTPT